MKSKMIILALAVVLGMTLYPLAGYAHMESGMMGRGGGGGQGYDPQQEGGWNYSPYCGRSFGHGGGYGMGPGMMGRGMGPGMMGRGMGPGMMGRGMGPGMMHRGWGMEPQYGQQYQQPQKPMEEQDARAILENYLGSTRNPNLKLGKIEDKGATFEAEILTKNNSMVDKIIVDKYSGWMRSIY